MVLKAAIELDLLEIIAKKGPDGSFSASELAAQILDLYDGFNGFTTLVDVGGGTDASLKTYSDSLKILKNCCEALSKNGKMIVVESVLPEVPDSTRATQVVLRVDMIMMAHNPGGKEMTLKDFEALAKGAGLKGSRKTFCVLNLVVMEFYK
nr:caffeic acid 3-O-methyltransferase [Tanacetum cinerariifolium]